MRSPMRAGNRLALLIGSIGAIGVLIVLAVVVTLPPSRVVSIAELRTGVDFVLASVRFHQTGFQEAPPDGGFAITVRVTFPDGATEDVEFHFDGYCPFGAVSEAVTAHRGPAAAFRHMCGNDYIRMTVAV